MNFSSKFAHTFDESSYRGTTRRMSPLHSMFLGPGKIFKAVRIQNNPAEKLVKSENGMKCITVRSHEFDVKDGDIYL